MKKVFVLGIILLILISSVSVVSAIGSVDLIPGFNRILDQVGKKIGEYLPAGLAPSRITEQQKGENFKGLLGKSPGGIDVTAPGFNKAFLNPLPSINVNIKNPQTSMPDEIESPVKGDSDLNQLCSLSIDGMERTVDVNVQEPNEHTWLFKCKDQFCSGDNAPCQQNPCSKDSKEICGSACCGEAYDASAKIGGLCAVEPDYDEDKNLKSSQMFEEMMKKREEESARKQAEQESAEAAERDAAQKKTPEQPPATAVPITPITPGDGETGKPAPVEERAQLPSTQIWSGGGDDFPKQKDNLVSTLNSMANSMPKGGSKLLIAEKNGKTNYVEIKRLSNGELIFRNYLSEDTPYIRSKYDPDLNKGPITLPAGTIVETYYDAKKGEGVWNLFKAAVGAALDVYQGVGINTFGQPYTPLNSGSFSIVNSPTTIESYLNLNNPRIEKAQSEDLNQRYVPRSVWQGSAVTIDSILTGNFVWDFITGRAGGAGVNTPCCEQVEDEVKKDIERINKKTKPSIAAPSAQPSAPEATEQPSAAQPQAAGKTEPILWYDTSGYSEEDKAKDRAITKKLGLPDKTQFDPIVQGMFNQMKTGEKKTITFEGLDANGNVYRESRAITKSANGEYNWIEAPPSAAKIAAGITKSLGTKSASNSGAITSVLKTRSEELRKQGITWLKIRAGESSQQSTSPSAITTKAVQNMITGQADTPITGQANTPPAESLSNPSAKSKYDDKIKEGACGDGYYSCYDACQDAANKLAGSMTGDNIGQWQALQKKFEDEANIICKEKAKECRDSCLTANQKCRAGDRSCQRLAKEKVDEYYKKLPTDEHLIVRVPKEETKSCYDQSMGMNRHAMTAEQVAGLNDWQKYDWANGMHPDINGNLAYVSDNKLKGESYIPYNQNYLIGNRPLSPEAMANRIEGGNIYNNYISAAALNAKGAGWDNSQSYGNKAVAKLIAKSRREIQAYYGDIMHRPQSAIPPAQEGYPGKAPVAVKPGAKGAAAGPAGVAQRELFGREAREARSKVNPRALNRGAIINVGTGEKVQFTRQQVRRGENR